MRHHNVKEYKVAPRRLIAFKKINRIGGHGYIESDNLVRMPLMKFIEIFFNLVRIDFFIFNDSNVYHSTHTRLNQYSSTRIITHYKNLVNNRHCFAIISTEFKIKNEKLN